MTDGHSESVSGINNTLFNMIDLHTHTVYSDGSMTPCELIDKAVEIGLSHIAITDHDTIAGLHEALDYAKILNSIKVIPAIEFSCHHKTEDIHILAYYIPINNRDLQVFLESKYEKREERFLKVIEKLQNLGFPIFPDEVNAYAPGGMKMAPQIVKVLFDKGIIKSEAEARKFVIDYLMPKKPAYVEHGDNPKEIISFFHELKALISVAHPHKIQDDSILWDLIAMGIDGLEVYYPNINEYKKNQIWEMIKENGLVPTGGSDFHGVYSDNKLGSGNVPESIIEEMEKALFKVRSV